MEYLTDTEHLSTDNGNNEREWNFEFHLGCKPTKERNALDFCPAFIGSVRKAKEIWKSSCVSDFLITRACSSF